MHGGPDPLRLALGGESSSSARGKAQKTTEKGKGMKPRGAGAVMASRREPPDSLDYFPTVPWATRALFERVFTDFRGGHVHEPACGEGHMARVLGDYFDRVTAEDVFPYGFGGVRDWLDVSIDPYRDRPDWIATNPPFIVAERFVHLALQRARKGVAIFARSAFAEGQGRYRDLWSTKPPSLVAIFSERVPLVKGRVDSNASTATSYAWFVWLHQSKEPGTLLHWIPPCRAELERPGDYQGRDHTPGLFDEAAP